MIARRAAAALALGGMVLLAIAEFTTVLEVTVGSLEVVRRSATGGENHGYALLVVAAVAALMAVAALRGARPPALALVALGLAGLVIALAVDLPDTRGSGGLPESLAYEQARARAGPALVLELTGSLLLVAAGALLLAGRREPPEREDAGSSDAGGPGAGASDAGAAGVRASDRRARADARAGAREQQH